MCWHRLSTGRSSAILLSALYTLCCLSSAAASEMSSFLYFSQSGTCIVNLPLQRSQESRKAENPGHLKVKCKSGNKDDLQLNFTLRNAL